MTDEQTDPPPPRYIPWYARINFGVLATIGLQTLALVAWLTQMHSDIEFLKSGQRDSENRLNAIDLGGSKAAALLDQRVKVVDDRHHDIEKDLEQLSTRVTEATKMINELSLLAARESPKTQGQIDSLVLRLRNVEETLVSRQKVIDTFVQQQGQISPLQQAFLDNLRTEIVRISDRLARIESAVYPKP